MNQYIVSKSSTQMVCIGCLLPMAVTNLRIKVLEGRGFLAVDSRPKTPTGGRLGLASGKRRAFPKFKTGPGCPGCALKHTAILPLPKSMWRK